MKRYLFFVNQSYSYAILRPLQEAIRSRGDEVAWFVLGCSAESLTSAETHLKTVKEVMAYRACATFAPGDWSPYFFPGIKVTVFHGFAIRKRGEMDDCHFRIRGWFDLLCTHGNEDTARFQALAEKHGHFAVVQTGWPKLDPLFESPQASVETRPDKCFPPTVFYASTFSRQVTSAPDLVETISRLADSGRWRFIVTLHPKMPGDIVSSYRALSGENVRYVESDQEVLPLMQAADIMLCDTSSIMFEYMFLNKPVVTLRTRLPGDYLLNVDAPEHIEAALETALTRPESMIEGMRRLCDEFHPMRDALSSERVLDAVEHFLAQTHATLKPKPLNFLRKLRVRYKLNSL